MLLLVAFWICYGLFCAFTGNWLNVLLSVGGLAGTVLVLAADRVNQGRIGNLRSQVDILQRRNDAVIELKNSIEDKAAALAHKIAVLEARNRALKGNGHG